jgi:hypothetical protein
VVAKFIKRLQKIIYLPLPKKVIYCIPPPSGMVHRKRALSLTTMGCCIAPWTSKFSGPDVLDSPQRHQVKEPPPSSGGYPLLLYTVGLLMVASPSRLPHSVLLDSLPEDACHRVLGLRPSPSSMLSLTSDCCTKAARLGMPHQPLSPLHHLWSLLIRLHCNQIFLLE